MRRHWLVLVRHAQPESCAGVRDPRLCEKGLAQATRLGDWLMAAEWPVQRVVSSPLRRSQQTADIVAARLGQSLIVEGLVAEVGSCTPSQRLWGVDAPEPEDFEPRFAPTRPTRPGGETWLQFATRVGRFARKLEDEYRSGRLSPGGVSVVVTHAGVVNALYAELDGGLGARPVEWAIDHTGLTIFSVAPDDRRPWILHGHNVLPHLAIVELGRTVNECLRVARFPHHDS